MGRHIIEDDSLPQYRRGTKRFEADLVHVVRIVSEDDDVATNRRHRSNDLVNSGLANIDEGHGHRLIRRQPDNAITHMVQLFEETWSIAIRTSESDSWTLDMRSDLDETPTNVRFVRFIADLTGRPGR